MSTVKTGSSPATKRPTPAPKAPSSGNQGSSKSAPTTGTSSSGNSATAKPSSTSPTPAKPNEDKVTLSKESRTDSDTQATPSSETAREPDEKDFAESYEGMEQRERDDLFSPYHQKGLKSSEEAARGDVARAQAKKDDLKAEADDLERSYQASLGEADADVSKARTELEVAKTAYEDRLKEVQELEATDPHVEAQKAVDRVRRQQDLATTLGERSKRDDVGYKHGDGRRRREIADKEGAKWNDRLSQWQTDIESGKRDYHEVSDEMKKALDSQMPPYGEEYEKARRDISQLAMDARDGKDKRESLDSKREILGLRDSSVTRAQGTLGRKEAYREGVRERAETRVGEAREKAENAPVPTLEEARGERVDHTLDSFDLSPEVRKAVDPGNADITGQAYKDGVLHVSYDDGTMAQAESDDSGLFVRSESGEGRTVRETQYVRGEDGELQDRYHQSTTLDENGETQSYFRRVGTEDGARQESSYRKADGYEVTKDSRYEESGSGVENQHTSYADGRERRSERVLDQDGKTVRERDTSLDAPRAAGDIDVDGLSRWRSQQPQHLADRLGDDGTVRTGRQTDKVGDQETKTDLVQYTSADGDRVLTSYDSDDQATRWTYEEKGEDYQGRELEEKQTFFQGTRDTVTESTTRERDGGSQSDSEGVMWETADAAAKNGQKIPGYMRTQSDVEPEQSGDRLREEIEALGDPELLKNPLVQDFLANGGDQLTLTDSRGMQLSGGDEDDREKAQELAGRLMEAEDENGAQRYQRELESLGFDVSGQEQLEARTPSGETLRLSRSDDGGWQVSGADELGTPVEASSLQAKDGVSGDRFVGQVKNRLTSPGKLQQFAAIKKARKVGMTSSELAKTLQGIEGQGLSRVANGMGLVTGAVSVAQSIEGFADGDLRQGVEAGATAVFEYSQAAKAFGAKGKGVSLLGRGFGSLAAGFDLWNAGKSAMDGDYGRAGLYAVSGGGTLAGIWSGTSWMGPAGWGAAALASIGIIGMDYHDSNKIAPLTIGE